MDHGRLQIAEQTRQHFHCQLRRESRTHSVSTKRHNSPLMSRIHKGPDRQNSRGNRENAQDYHDRNRAARAEISSDALQRKNLLDADTDPDLRSTFWWNSGSDLASRKLLEEINRRHLAVTGTEDALLARMKSYELAAKMQLAVPDVTDLKQETAATRLMYGLDKEETSDFGSRCLLARRLLEKGVRFVQLFSGGSFGSPRINWDGHEDVKENHTREAGRLDQPVAALLKDLRQRGMLEDTLILCTSEFGRTPFTQSGADQVGTGRDHNMYGFSIWMAGAGLKHGVAYGATDEIGWKAVEKPVHWYDYHATVLHLLGIDHERLTYYHNGIQRRLTNVHGEVLHDIMV